MRRALAFILVVVAVSSCEKEPSSPVDSDFSSPFIVTSGLAASGIDLDDSSSASYVTHLSNGKYRITDTVTAQVSSPLGFNDIRTVSFWLYAPGATQYFATGTLSFTGAHPTAISGVYSGSIIFDLDRSDIGAYRCEIRAAGATHAESNTHILPLAVSRMNSRPTTANLVSPDTLYRPTAGFQLIQFSISVSDSDGYGDIQDVFLKRISPTASSLIPLYDDGDQQLNGDTAAGDGTFSRILRIDNTAILGEQVFLFQAMDRSGALSDTLLHTITIVQGP